jgi:RES domain
MNAKGITVFYGATTPEIALAEVRPPVGSQVAIARFEITRPLRLLDLTALAEVHEHGSIFDPGYADRLGRMMFLRTLSARMARPVMPDDQETVYLPTQAIADYLATEGKVPLDGILFPSVQVGGSGDNIVLFHKAARCAELDIPEGTEIEARTYSVDEDGPEPDYSVTEEVPPEEQGDEEAGEPPFRHRALHP